MNALEASLNAARDAVPGVVTGALALVPEGVLLAGVGSGGALEQQPLVRSAARLADGRAQLSSHLAALAGSGRQIVAFVLDGEQDCLLPLTTLSTPSVAELRLLAHFASAMPRVSLELAQGPRFTLACTEDGHAAVVWWKEGVLFAELCQDRASLAVATVRHLACE